MNKNIYELQKLVPTKIYFGENSSYQLIDLLEKLSTSRLLIIGSKRSLKDTFLSDIIKKIEKKIKIFTFNKVTENPSIRMSDECYQIFKNEKIDTLLGIGGGSALDLSKAVALSLDRQKLTSDLIYGSITDVPRKITLILIPTTSGTGSELSFGSILTDENNKIKKGLRGKVIAANHAIIDPKLTYSLPMKNTMITGFDVLTHSIETYISKKSNIHSEKLSKKALSIVFEFLPLLRNDLNNESARYNLSYASMIMGINLSISSTCLPHRIQYPIGALTNTPHAVGLASLYPAWLSHLTKFADEKLNNCDRWISNFSDSITSNSAINFIENVKSFIKKINLDYCLEDLGIHEDEILNIAGQVEGNLDHDPSYQNHKDLINILHNSFSR